jgi:hypothetical protein
MSFHTTVNRLDLLKKLQDNRDQHEQIYTLAVQGYIEAVTQELKDKLQAVKDGDDISRHLTNVKPENHLDDYDEVIGMMSMNIESEVTLDQSLFRQYVMDQWNWKQQFVTSTSLYTS